MAAPAAVESAPQASAPGRLVGVPLIAATFLFWLGLYTYVPFLPGYARDLGANATWVGIVTASYGFAQLVLRIPTGVWSDRLGRRKPFILAGCALAALSAASFTVATDPLGLLLARTLAGVAATTWLAFTVLYTAYFPKSSGSAMAVIVFVNTLGVLVGQVVGPLLLGPLGPHGVFWLSAAIGGLAVLLALLAPDRSVVHRGAAPSARSLFLVGRNRVLLTVSLLAAVSQYLVHGGSLVFVNDWAQQRLGATGPELGTLALASGVPGAAATLLGGTWFARRFGNRAVVTAGFLIAGATIAVVPLVPDLGALYWSQALGGLARGFTLPLLMAMALQSVPRERSASAIGFFQATYSLGMTAGPFLTGIVADTSGPASGFWLMGLLAILAAGATLWGVRGPGSSPGETRPA